MIDECELRLSWFQIDEGFKALSREIGKQIGGFEIQILQVLFIRGGSYDNLKFLNSPEKDFHTKNNRRIMAGLQLQKLSLDLCLRAPRV